MNQLQICTDKLLKMLLDDLQMRIDDEYYEEVSTTKSDLDKKELTLDEACHRIRFMYDTYQESDFSDWIFELDRFADTMDRILMCLKPVYETHPEFLEAQKIINEIRVHSEFIDEMLRAELYGTYKEDQS